MKIKGLLFLLLSAVTFSCFGQNKKTMSVGLDTSLVLNNAALSMRYYNLFYGKKPPPSSNNVDSVWKKTLIILNDDKVLSSKEFLNMDKKRIMSIKEIPVPKDGMDIKRIILLKSK